MNKRYRVSLLLGCLLLVLVLALSACASAAPSPEGEGGQSQPVVAQQDPTPESEPAPEPTPEADPTKEPKSEPTPEPTPEADPTKEPESDGADHSPRVIFSGQPRPTRTPEPSHPGGLDGCKGMGLFTIDPTTDGFHGWCADQLAQRVANDCGPLPDAQQRQCGEDTAGEYRSYLMRLSVGRCLGIPSGTERVQECLTDTVHEYEQVQLNLWEGWEKVQTVGDRAPEVIKAMDAVIVCLEGDDHGFNNVGADLLFPWQDFTHPKEHRAKEDETTGSENDLRERLVEPSQTCAKEEGLFVAQDASWAAELRRLSNDEPGLVADLVQEGLLEELDKPGASALLTGSFITRDGAS